MDNVYIVSTREKIVRSTLDLIKKNGFQNVTVRKIANNAKVNIASINYYFGSKDAVINEALKHVTDELLGSFGILEAKDLEPELKLRKFLQDYSDVIDKYPDIIRNFISLIMNNCETQITYKDFLKETGFRLIKEAIQELHPNEDEATVKMRVMQLMSCTGYPILLGHNLIDISSFDYSSQEQRYKYMELLLNSIVK